ncbi:GapS6a family protein [Maridesulfovibrio hydrothermalis]|uniref:Uncharacterized protein n=1 Tax=Maridesulfovibrio hydrothermalis AM13 = DSM 14728 TaxID=1121451 RepID=L0RB94_9BACT|nr:hypothetical protein [Maridesulfovibrio hydrothermalis]CCO24058.1 conserved protein of unknown function [Maridesulfovibrio hydrothermalis AM13 = DSM 14728]
MDFVAASFLSGVIYDIMKTGAQVGLETLKPKFMDWLVDDDQLNTIAKKVDDLSLNDEMSEKAIERKISEDRTLVSLIENLQPRSTTTINQNHNGTGDNVGRDKVVRS